MKTKLTTTALAILCSVFYLSESHAGTAIQSLTTDSDGNVIVHKRDGTASGVLSAKTGGICGAGNNICSSGLITAPTVDSGNNMTTLPTPLNIKWFLTGSHLTYSGFMNSQNGSARDYGWKVDLPPGFTVSGNEDCTGNMVGADTTDVQVCRITADNASEQLVFSCTDGGGADPTSWGGAFVAVCLVD